MDDYLEDDDAHGQPAATALKKADNPGRSGGFSRLTIKSKFISQLLGSGKFDDDDDGQKEPLLPLYRRNDLNVKNGWKGIGPGLRVMVDEQQQDKVQGRRVTVNGRRQAKIWVKTFLISLVLLLVLACLGHFAWKAVGLSAAGWSEDVATCSDARLKFCHLVIGIKS